jgi:hypothetical protein
MKKFVFAATAAVVMLSAMPVSAATVFFPGSQVLNVSTGSAHFGATVNDNKPAGALFTHIFKFSTVGSYIANGATITTRLGANNRASDIDFTSIKLDGFSYTQLTNDLTGFGTETWALAPTLLSSGLHTLTVKGKEYSTLRVAASYAGTLNIAAVPEPATWAMMLVGFGLVSGAARRRRSVGLVSA